MQKILRRAIPVLLLVLAAGCSRPPPPPKVAPPKPAPPKPAPPPPEEDGMAVSGTLGTLDEHAIQNGVGTRLQRAAACYQREARRRPYLAGTIALEFRVATDGRTKRLRILESTLGAWEVERCVQEEMKAATFSRPRGGEAEFTYPLSFDGRVDAQVWDPGMVSEEMSESRDALLGIKKERPRKRKRRGKRRRKIAPPADVALVAPEGLTLTFYVDWRGRVVSAGMVAVEPIDEDFASRFIANLRQVRFHGATSGKYAKVIYRW